ncbi:MAG: glutaredoxin domain-containing protein [Burkholderiales bacterium]
MEDRDGGHGGDVNARRTLPLIVLVVAAAAGMKVLQGWTQVRLGSQVAALAKPGDIQMIASTTCIYCAQARAWFNANDVPFSECLIERDAPCAEVYATLTAPGTPVLLVRGRRLVGFSAQAVADALGATR